MRPTSSGKGSGVVGIPESVLPKVHLPRFFRFHFPSHFAPLCLHFLSPMMNINVHITRYVPDRSSNPQSFGNRCTVEIVIMHTVRSLKILMHC